MTSKQKQAAYRRFYKALVTHWVAIEHLSIARAVAYPTAKERNLHMKWVHELWRNNRDRPLQDKLDIVEVADFVWEFLARKVFDTTHLGVPFHESRLRKLYLRPPHLIEALILSAWPYPDSFSDSFGILESPSFHYDKTGVITGKEADQGGADHTNFNSDIDLEDDVGNSLVRLQDEDMSATNELRSQRKLDYRLGWSSYRRRQWKTDDRGKVLFRTDTDELLTERIAGKPSHGGLATSAVKTR